MKTKTCFKCNVTQPLDEFYKHPQMGDGHLNKCKQCTKSDNKTSNGVQKRSCLICRCEFKTTTTEVKRGGGLTCSRTCHYQRQRQITPKGEDSPLWKGDKVGRVALHQWVQRNLGKPRKCSYCGTTKANKYDWANKTQLYKRDLSDWLRLCRQCHIRYDRSHPLSGWNISKNESPQATTN